MGVYQDGVAKDTINGKDVQAHIFEYVHEASLPKSACLDRIFRYTTQVMVTPNGEVSQAPCPVQVVFCCSCLSIVNFHQRNR